MEQANPEDFRSQRNFRWITKLKEGEDDVSRYVIGQELRPLKGNIP